MLLVIMVALGAFCCGAIYGRSGARAEQRQAPNVVPAHRLYVAFGKGDRKS